MAILTRIDLRLYARVLVILTKYGKDADFTIANQSYDPLTGRVAGDGPLVYTVKITPPAPAEQMMTKEVLSAELTGKTMILFAVKNLPNPVRRSTSTVISGLSSLRSRRGTQASSKLCTGRLSRGSPWR